MRTKKPKSPSQPALLPQPSRWETLRLWLQKHRRYAPPTALLLAAFVWRGLEVVSMLDWLSSVASGVLDMTVNVGAAGSAALLSAGLLWWSVLVMRDGKARWASFASVSAVLVAAYGAFTWGQSLPNRTAIQNTVNPFERDIAIQFNHIYSLKIQVHSAPLQRFDSKYGLAVSCAAVVQGTGLPFPNGDPDAMQTSVPHPIQVPMTIEMPLVRPSPILRPLCQGIANKVRCAVWFVDGKTGKPPKQGRFSTIKESPQLVTADFPKLPVCQEVRNGDW